MVGCTILVPETAASVEKLVPVHVVALALLQVSVVWVPAVMDEAEEVKVEVGAVGVGVPATVMVTDLVTLPPVPVQTME